jgi:hypothetical protein
MRGTKKRLAVSLVSLLILAVTLTSFACSSNKSSEATPTPTPQATPIVHATSMEYAIEAFQRFPIEWDNGRYIDLAAFRQDTGLASIYEELNSAAGPGLASVGIDLSLVDHVSFVGGQAAVYSGRLDLTGLRPFLSGIGYERNTYLNVEIWISPDQGKSVITLLPPNSVLITGNRQDAETCISVVEGWAASQYDDANIQGLLSRLPDNPLRVDISHSGDSGPLATASSVTKTGVALETLSLSVFIDDVSAEKGLTAVTADFKSRAYSWNMVSVETVQIRSFIKSTGSVNIANIGKGANPLGYMTYWLY